MLYSCEILFSHPGKPLEQHLSNVSKAAKDWVNKLQLNLDIDKAVLTNVVYLIGLAHDLGKSTESFQRYLCLEDEEEKKKMKNKEQTRHSPLGAFCGYYLIREYVRINSIAPEYAEYLPIVAFITIKRHHGDLNSIIEETAKSKEEKIQSYLLDVNINKFDTLLANLFKDIPEISHCNYSWFEEKAKAYKNDMRTVRSFIRRIGKKKELDYFFLNNLMYSILVDADKCDASGLNEEYTGRIIPDNLVDEYRNIEGYSTPNSKLNCLRNNIYQDATHVYDAMKEGKHILSINVPTGTGKTFTALSVSLKIRSYLNSKEGINRSIVYALPFTSIIDQNYQVFNNVFTKVMGTEPGNDLLLKHHYLADGFYRVKEDDDEFMEYSPLESRFIAEGWNSSIIVTTFVQLFHSIITNRNLPSRKFHRIINSIIILDEIQAIPHRYWSLLRNICLFMAEKMDTYFIFVSATLPLIFLPEEIHELVTEKEDYYKALNRIDLKTHIEKIVSIDEFQEIVKNEALSNPDKDLLVVMNTIKSAQLVYEYLLEEMGTEENVFYYLSSHVVPAERVERINAIKRNKDKRKIVISTQLIEAGVDIDMDIVFRDFGPLDSINQVAGRCNRNLMKDRGIVKLYYVKRGNKPDSSYIYDSTLLDTTIKIINGYAVEGCIEEKDFFNLSNCYYETLHDGVISDADSQNVLEAVWSLNYKRIQDFKLIDEGYEKVDIFVEIDEKAQETWRRFINLGNIEDKWQRREEFYRFKNTFQQYIISVQKQAEWLNSFTDTMVGGIYHISSGIADTYYKREGYGDTGFVTEGDSYAIW